MYSKELSQENKKLFIREYYNQDSYLEAKETVFNKTRIYEEEFKRDLCQMSVEQIDEMLSGQRYCSLSYIETCVSVMRKYCNFCMNDGKSALHSYFNHFESDLFSKRNLKKYLQENECQKYITIEDLEKYCHILQSYDNGDITSGLLYCLFYGMKAADLYHFTLTDMNIEERSIRTSDGSLIQNLDQGIIDTLLRVYRQTKMIDGKGSVSIYSPFPNGVFKCKPYMTEKKGLDITYDIFYTFIYNLMKRSKDSIAKIVGNEKITPDSIYISGFLYFVKKCCERDGVSFDMLTSERHIKLNMCETLCRYGIEYGYLKEKEINMKTGARLRDLLKKAGTLYG